YIHQRVYKSLYEWNLQPAANVTHQLRCRSALGLLFQHPKRVGQAEQAVPAKFHVVIQTAANRMDVGVVKAGNDAAAFEIDHHGVIAALRLLHVTYGYDAAVLDSQTSCFGPSRVKCSDAPVVKNHVGSEI